MTIALSHPLLAKPSPLGWMQDRLTEARWVLADASHHPQSLIILAARVVAGQTDDTAECAEALDLLRLMDRRPLHAIAASVLPNRGAA